MAFRIQGRITDCGKVIRFEQTNTGVPAALGFDVVLKSSYLKDRLLEFECCLQHWSQSYFGPHDYLFDGLEQSHVMSDRENSYADKLGKGGVSTEKNLKRLALDSSAFRQCTEASLRSGGRQPAV